MICEIVKIWKLTTKFGWRFQVTCGNSYQTVENIQKNMLLTEATQKRHQDWKRKTTKNSQRKLPTFPMQSDKGSQFRLHCLIFIAFAEQWCIIPTWSFANQCNKLTVSENRGIPKSSILIGFSIVNHPFWGTPIFGNPQIDFCLEIYMEISWSILMRL